MRVSSTPTPIPSLSEVAVVINTSQSMKLFESSCHQSILGIGVEEKCSPLPFVESLLAQAFLARAHW
jgi:hypothetical protein